MITFVSSLNSNCREWNILPPVLSFVWGPVALFGLCLSSRGFADSGAAHRVKEFAHRLELQGEYSVAQSEYRRLLFYSVTPLDSFQALAGRMRTLAASGQPLRALEHCQKLRNLASAWGWETPAANLRLTEAALLTRAGDIEGAAESAWLWYQSRKGGTVSMNDLFSALVMQLKAERREEAGLITGNINALCPGFPADSLRMAWEKSGNQSSFIAGLLSGLLPGLGQAYAGHPASGLNSFWLNAVTGFGFINAWKQARAADIALYFWLFERFYRGGIVVAMESVRLDNHSQWKSAAMEFRRNMKNRCAVPSSGDDSEHPWDPMNDR